MGLQKRTLHTRKRHSLYYSPVPKMFRVAVSGFFDIRDESRSFIDELGRIGISIGGETLKSGRHALGVVGLVGAVRLFQESLGTIPAPLNCNLGCLGCVGFLIPVDSFASFFGKSGISETEVDGKRGDLIAIQLVLPQVVSSAMVISCCSVEAKFTSRTYSATKARSALSQASATTTEFDLLVNSSIGEGAMPERLALLELLRFGMRISSPVLPSKSNTKLWIKTEATVYKAILTGNYEYRKAKHSAVLVSTEKQLSGAAELNVLGEWLWIRLNKGHWPGTSDTPQLDSIRTKLSDLFDFRSNRTTYVETRSPDVLRDTNPVAEENFEEREQNSSSAKNTLFEEGDIPSEDKRETNRNSEPLHQILIGVDDSRRSVYFNPQSPIDPLDNINMMITGSSGTGKTQLLKYVVCKICAQDKPVLVLDFKNDFVSDEKFAELSGLLRNFIAFDGLPYNPLIPYPIKHPETGDLLIQCGQHIAGVASVLTRTYRLGTQQQVAVKNAMKEAFSSVGISTDGAVSYSDNLDFPDFADVGSRLQRDNPLAYNRLDPLFTLGLFKEQYRNASLQTLVGNSQILDLSQIPSDEIKNALAQLIVLSAHAYYNTQPHSGAIRQVLVFDEAHRILESDYILKLVRECRAYGVAILLSSQYPSDFPSEISASMATKVIHGNGGGSEKVKSIVQLVGCDGMQRDVASLERFQAFVDNRHYPHTIVRTMNYPLYLIWSTIQKVGMATPEELSLSEGLDTSKLPIGNLIKQLERLGFVEEHGGKVHVLNGNSTS